MNLNELTIKQAQELLKKGEITSVDLTKACLARIKKVNKKLNACLTVCEKEALKEAREADEKIKKGGKGALLGIPYLCKANIMTKGVETNAGSKILENYNAPYDATVIKKLKEAGAVLLGKTNMDEFGHGASTENSAFGPTHNPYDLERVSGGSSGGSAAGVAADMCLFALGTDTGGSIRHPAGFCGVVGLKPTYGRASRFGLISMTSSTDVPGVITKTVLDAEIVLKVIAGVDKNDSTTVETSQLKVGTSLQKNIKGLTIGLPKEYFIEGINKNLRMEIEKAIAKLKELGAEFKEVSLPHTKYGIPVYYIITPSEISSNLARFDGIRYGFSYAKASENKYEDNDLMSIYTKSRGKGFGSEVKRRIMLGTYALSAGYYDAYYLKAQKVRTLIKEEMDLALEKVDCLLTPMSPHVAFKIGKQVDDPLKMYLEDIFVTGASLAGLPAISIPCGFAKPDDGTLKMPVGMQLIGSKFNESILFRIGKCFEEKINYHQEKFNL
jgi:aspartyl-tRNA(Asn)/glutamyl-tRNA(Gln) amidotransferase subunit A